MTQAEHPQAVEGRPIPLHARYCGCGLPLQRVAGRILVCYGTAHAHDFTLYRDEGTYLVGETNKSARDLARHILGATR